MTQDEMTAAFGARHHMHLQSVLGAQGAEALALRARLDVVEQHAADLEKEVASLTTQRDEALHMQAETMKTVEHSGAEIERLRKALDALRSEFQEYAANHDPDPAERKRFSKKPPGPAKPRTVNVPHPDPKNPRV